MNRKPAIRRYMLLEMIVAFGLLVVISSALIGVLRMMSRVDRKFTDEHRAVLALDNLVERLHAEKHYDEAKIKKYFAEEFNNGGLKKSSQLHWKIVKKPGKVRVSVLNMKNREQAGVDIPCQTP